MNDEKHFNFYIYICLFGLLNIYIFLQTNKKKFRDHQNVVDQLHNQFDFPYHVSHDEATPVQ